ncbi:hypothetical protein GCM10009564_42500 [Streptomyces thermogriseus]|uniref:Uncharacterized protein n=1 Tax=Streptomyces thermogriseus TaxID=75292 RepID=A0ABN1T3K2_9ACTN
MSVRAPAPFASGRRTPKARGDVHHIRVPPGHGAKSGGQTPGSTACGGRPLPADFLQSGAGGSDKTAGPPRVRPFPSPDPRGGGRDKERDKELDREAGADRMMEGSRPSRTHAQHMAAHAKESL